MAGLVEGHLARERRDDEAVVAMKQAWSGHYASWMDADNPCLGSLHSREDFRELHQAIFQRTSRERTRLGWTPLEVSSL